MPSDDPHSPDFRPPFCPNPNCLYHRQLTTGWRCKKAGFFSRRLPPRRIQRFTCLHCRRSFSSQTFSTTYWQKRPEITPALFTKITACMSARQIAHDLKAAPETINRHIGRLARHCMLFHAKQMQTAPPPTELVLDGLVTFEWSQYFPFHHNVVVEKGTDFFLYFNDSEVRRSGGMSEVQKRRRKELERLYGRPDPQAVRKAVAEALGVCIGRQPGVVLYTDDHRSYPPAIRSLPVAVRHVVISSREHRNACNPLWEGNLLELVIRHGSANHKRETIAWSKRRQCSAERLVVLLVNRDYLRGRREKDRRSATPAMERGMCGRRLTAEEVLRVRLFPTRIGLPGAWEGYYWRRVRTRALAVNREHGLRYAM
jgi:transposase-like protein